MIYTDAPQINPTLRAEDLPGSFGSALGSTATMALYNSPTSQIVRTLEDANAGGPRLDYETARTRAQAAGVSVKIDPSGIKEGELDLLINRRRKIDRENYVISKGPQGFLPGAAYFVTGLGASLLDPINVASAFIPVARVVGMADDVARAGMLGAEGAAATAGGRFAARTRVGAVEGAVGQALVEPLTAYRANVEQEDYGITDTLLNIGFGTVLGSVAHSGLGALGDRALAVRRQDEAKRLIELSKNPDSAAAKLNRADMETHSAIFTTEVAAAVEGRKIDSTPLLGIQAQEINLDDLDLSLFGDIGAPAPASAPRAGRISTAAAWEAKDFDRNTSPSSTDLAALRASIEKNGFDANKPITITVSTADGMGYVTDGNNRLAAARSLGLPDVPYKVELTDVPFTEAQRAKAQPVDKLGLKPEDLTPKAKSPEALAAEAELRRLMGEEPSVDATRVKASVEASLRPENDVHYDATAKAEVDQAVKAQSEADPQQAINQALQETQAELAMLSKQLGIDPEKNAAMRAADETVALANKYSRAVEALASCQART